MKWPNREADHSPTTSTENDTWNYMSAPSCLRDIGTNRYLDFSSTELVTADISSSTRWTFFNCWKFRPSQRPPSSISLDPGRKLSNFWSSFGKCPIWCYPPICTWVFLVIFWSGVSKLNIFLTVLVSDILCTWPTQLSLWKERLDYQKCCLKTTRKTKWVLHLLLSRFSQRKLMSSLTP